jgi:hypothetical protein
MEWEKAKLQAELGLNTKAEAEKLFNQYHDNVPFCKRINEQDLSICTNIRINWNITW